jgi:hypothetical protein
VGGLLAAGEAHASLEIANPDVRQRLVIVNADDLGLSDEIDRGIFEAHDRGIVTSASLLVDGPHAADAVRLARQRPDLGLGIHPPRRALQPGARGGAALPLRRAGEGRDRGGRHPPDQLPRVRADRG